MQVSFPGVYIEEIAAAVHPIEGVPTSTAAFVGATLSGPIDAPLPVHSLAEFQTRFGALAADLPLGYAVQQYFLNGGREALIARVAPSGAALTDADLSDPALEAQQRGLWLLDRAEHFEILCIPPLSRTADVGRVTWDAAIALAERRRAMVIVDPPAAWTSPASISEAAIAALARRSRNAALYYPRLRAPDPLNGNQVASFAPGGAVAGVYARTDAARGVWTAPAGTQATVLGAQGLSAALSEAQVAALEAIGVNALRTFPGVGVVVWGARTLPGADGADSEYRYIPVRRLALFVEESLYRGVQWVVFEPNGEPAWAAIRRSVSEFLHGLFQKGALRGTRPEEAYFVRCDGSTMTQQDIDSGHIVALVGVAPLKPAEFIILKIGIWTSGRRRYAVRVTWDAQAIAGVTRVCGLGQHTELVSVQEGGDPASAQVMVGRTSFAPVTIARPISNDGAFAQWAAAMRASGPGSGAPPPKKDVRIEFHDPERGVMVAWRLVSAMVVKHQVPDLNAAGTDVAIEELTLAHEGLELDPG